MLLKICDRIGANTLDDDIEMDLLNFEANKWKMS